MSSNLWIRLCCWRTVDFVPHHFHQKESVKVQYEQEEWLQKHNLFIWAADSWLIVNHSFNFWTQDVTSPKGPVSVFVTWRLWISTCTRVHPGVEQRFKVSSEKVSPLSWWVRKQTQWRNKYISDQRGALTSKEIPLLPFQETSRELLLLLGKVKKLKT